MRMFVHMLVLGVALMTAATALAQTPAAADGKADQDGRAG